MLQWRGRVCPILAILVVVFTNLDMLTYLCSLVGGLRNVTLWRSSTANRVNAGNTNNRVRLQLRNDSSIYMAMVTSAYQVFLEFSN